VGEILHDALHDKQLPFRAVLMDTWYAEHKLMLHIGTPGQAVLLPAQDKSAGHDSHEQHPY
jgi:hypothetical protein